MKTVYEHNGLEWVDLASPEPAELREVIEHYGLDPQLIEELATPTPKPSVNRFDGALFYILHFPAFKHTHRAQKNQEVDFIITERALITVRYDTIDPIHKFAKQFEVNAILERDRELGHAGVIAYALGKKLYHAIEHELEYIQDALRDIESQIFAGREKDMVRELSVISRELLNFKQTLVPHRDVLEALERAAGDEAGGALRRYAAALLRERNRVAAAIEHSIDSLAELRTTNDSLLYTKQNEIMKTLTIMAFVTFPLTLITGIFGMNTQTLPLAGREDDFWVIIAAMAVLTAFFFAFFKYKRWL